MKKFSAVVVAVLGIFFAPSAAAADLRIGVEGAYPPFSAVNADGELVGFDIEIARALCAEMKTECELVQQDWDGIIPALLAKKYDAIIASMSDTEERRAQVSFTGHYYKDGAKFVRKAGSGIRVSYNGLAGKKVGVQRGTVTDNFLTAEFEGADIKRYDTLENAHLDLTQGRLDLVLADQFVQQDWADKNDGFETTGHTYTNPKYFGNIAIAVRKEDNQLRERLNAAILAIRGNGKYKAINDKYFKFDIYGR
ncbi:MAG: transporter substrate-binding domain-containing protein [Betaproteobacteria bacterium]|nr:transporter substrate-binding domain-containing protein [Betaproteobacteria bacterium]